MKTEPRSKLPRVLLKRVGMALLIAGLGIVTGCQYTLPVLTRNGWRPIFDGRSTNGWQMVGPGEFKLEHKQLVTYGGMGLLWYEREKLGNCQIRVVFKITAADDNSGVFIRIPTPPQDPMQAVNQGYEVQIDNNENEWHRTGCLYSLTKARKNVSPKVGQWSVMLITLDRDRTIVEIDGKRVTDYTEGHWVPKKEIWYEPERGLRPEYGYFGLQNHGKDAHVHFAGVSVRSLP